ncbi:MAG: hypothetical protein QNJ48_05950 [Desulfobacterales bacterium]|nr:hypothetical protein [Desulfobacterales bacterium]
MTETLYRQLDAFLMAFFRLAENPMLGYLTGIAVLALVCVILGDFSMGLAYRWNHAFLRRDNRRLVRLQNVSLRALKARDKESYQALNREANDAFGKVFFAQVALAAASLWPLPFAMQWLETRFGDVLFALPLALPKAGDTVGYAFTFLPMYILVRIVFGRLKGRLPYFRRIRSQQMREQKDDEGMLRFSDVFHKPAGSPKTGA